MSNIDTYVWRWKETEKTKNKKQSEDNIIKVVRSLFRLKKLINKATKNRIIRGIKNLFEQEKNYYNYIEYESKPSILME